MNGDETLSRPLELGRLSRVLGLLPHNQRRRLWRLGLLTMLNALCEAGAIALLLPMLRIVLNGEPPSGALAMAAAGAFPSLEGAELLAPLCFAVATLLLLSNALSALVLGESAYFGWDSWRVIAGRVFRFYLHRPFTFFLERSSPQLLKMTTTDTMSITQRVLVPLLQILARGSVIVAVTLTLTALFPLVALGIVIALGLAYVLIYRAVRPIIRRLSRALWSAKTAATRAVNEAYQGIREIRVFGREHAYATRFDDTVRDLPARERHHAMIRLAPRYLFEGGTIVTALTAMGLAALAGYPLASIGPTVGVCAVAGFRLLPMCTQIYVQFVSIRFGLTELEPLLADIADVDIDALEPEDGAAMTHGIDALPLSSGELHLQGVGYRYPGAAAAALEEVTLTIPAGEIVGLIGPSGSGKSTLVDLILGLLTPSSGELRWGERTITADDAARFRRSIGYVPQHTFLIDADVTRNIAFGVPEAHIDHAAVARAASLSAVEQFVRELPLGFEQPLGERGIRLSGGQRQRIAIARALYHDPPIVLLDEATSSLDRSTEGDVLKAVSALRGRTVLLVTHRLETLQVCDRVYEIRNGRVTRVDDPDAHSSGPRIAGTSAVSRRTGD